MRTSLPALLRLLSASALLATLLSVTTGCGVLAAATNPKVAWAVGDPAPMSVVVRRADAAEKTSLEVDRLLTGTATPDDATWLDKTAPNKEDATQKLQSLRMHPIYQGQQARIVAAEVWSDLLPKVGRESKAAPAAPTPVATKGDAKADAKSGKKTKAGTTTTTAANVSAASSKAPKGAKTTPAAAASAPKASGPARSVLAVIDPNLGIACEEIMALRREIAQARAKTAQLEAQKDEKGVSASQKATLRREITASEKATSELEAKVSPKQKELLTRAKTSSGNVPPIYRDRIGSMLVNLRQAIDDANIANGAAAVRYPLAIPSLPDSTKAMVPVFVADIVEEQTGKRPSLQGFQPGVSLDGGSVKLTLNGLSQDDLGKLSVGQVTGQTLDRTQAWVGRALGLLGTVGATKDTLDFQADLVDAILSGMKASGYAAPAPPVLPEAPAPGATPTPAS
ncbi:MAG: hypothetical protein IPG50_00655 [Myxococcales bacterium]|nr:hypothetical protein [Myxococcales bacterium]